MSPTAWVGFGFSIWMGSLFTALVLDEERPGRWYTLFFQAMGMLPFLVAIAIWIAACEFSDWARSLTREHLIFIAVRIVLTAVSGYIWFLLLRFAWNLRPWAER